MRVGVPLSPPTYRSLLFLWLLEFGELFLRSYLGRLVVRYEPHMQTTVFLNTCVTSVKYMQLD